MSRLECRALTCGYPGRVVLGEVDFTVASEEIVALLGPNGSGKSTLLKTLVRTLAPISGEVLTDGAAVKGLSYQETAKRIAYVPQEEHAAFPFLALQIVLMGRIPHSPGLADTPEDLRLAREAMRRADCEDFADRPVTELSGGERQRVLIARALASQARVLLLDEPTSHLDAAHVVALVGLLKQLASEGYAVVAAVHDLNVAAMLGDRAVLLGNGRVRHDGPVREVLTGAALSEVYGIGFERLTDARGQLRVFPIGV